MCWIVWDNRVYKDNTTRRQKIWEITPVDEMGKNELKTENGSKVLGSGNAHGGCGQDASA